MTEDKPLSITDKEFENKVLNAPGIRVVDFWAPWCGPCVQMAPVLEAFTASNAGKIKVFKIDVDENPKTTEKLGIRSVPTIIFFRDGYPVYTSTGAMSEEDLQGQLRKLLGPDSGD